VANPRDEVAFTRMVKLLPGIGNRTADNLWRAWENGFAVAGIGWSAVASAKADHPGWEETFASAGGNAGNSENVLAPAGVSDPGYRFGERLLSMNVPGKSKKEWEQLAHTLDEIAPGGQPNPPSEMIRSVVEAIYDDYAKVNFTNYELRREDLDQLAMFARQFKDVHEFLSQLALISNVDAEAAPNQTSDREAVNLSTVHQAKGLEFHTVFVIWLTDGMFPSSRSLDTRDALEEERRLFYVAITRARDELYLTFPQMRLSGGYGDVFQRPSRFLKEIPGKLVEDWEVKRK
jgi:DNA helicase-2/ATP-dependent DNA helicase PcrA